jgi:hypothetical protein
MLAAPELMKQAQDADKYAKNLDARKWRKTRKMLKHRQHSVGAKSKY